MAHIFDSAFNTAAAIDMYRSWVVPEIDPEQPQPRLENWHPEDLEAYVGGIYTEGRRDAE